MKRVARRRPGLLPASFKALAALALALLVGDHVLPALHHALVAHEFCAEHGQLEHVGARAGAPPHHEKGGQVVDTSSPDASHHDDCSSVPASPPRAPLVAGFVALRDAAFGEAEPIIVASVAVPPADVVAFAPKQSPPA